MIFNDISELQEVTDVNIDSSFEAFKSSIRRSLRVWLTPNIGSVNVQLAKDIADGLFEGEKPDMDTAQTFIEMVREALGPLSVYMYIPRAEAQLTDGGIRRVNETETQAGAYKYQVNNLRDSYLNDGLDALESLLEFLEQNKTQFPGWMDSQEEREYNSLFIRSGAEFNELYTLSRPQLLYRRIRPMIRTVEEMILEKRLGETYKSLKEKQQNDIAFSEEEKPVVHRLKKAIANLSIWKSLASLQLKVDEHGITVLGSNSDASQGDISKRMAASGQSVSALQEEAKQWGYAYLDDATNYIEKVASPTLFPDAFNDQIKDKKETSSCPQPGNEILNGSFSM